VGWLGLAGCALDTNLKNACQVAEDCPAGQACVAGRCGAPLLPDAGLPPDVSADADGWAPDVSPDVPPDVAPDAAPDLAPDIGADVSPDAAQTLPIASGLTLNECEGSTFGMACGTWVWSEERQLFLGTWANGSVAEITVVENGTRVVLTRSDPAGVSKEINGDYIGQRVSDRKVEGTATWRSQVGGTVMGTWSATW
jgi:hypothetical protein